MLCSCTVHPPTVHSPARVDSLPSVVEPKSVTFLLPGEASGLLRKRRACAPRGRRLCTVVAAVSCRLIRIHGAVLLLRRRWCRSAPRRPSQPLERHPRLRLPLRLHPLRHLLQLRVACVPQRPSKFCSSLTRAMRVPQVAVAPVRVSSRRTRPARRRMRRLKRSK